MLLLRGRKCSLVWLCERNLLRYSNGPVLSAHVNWCSCCSSENVPSKRQKGERNGARSLAEKRLTALSVLTLSCRTSVCRRERKWQIKVKGNCEEMNESRGGRKKRAWDKARVPIVQHMASSRQLRRTRRTWTRLKTTADTEGRPVSMPQSPRQSRLLYSILDLILTAPRTLDWPPEVATALRSS